jgi:hypothetical protein
VRQLITEGDDRAHIRDAGGYLCVVLQRHSEGFADDLKLALHGPTARVHRQRNRRTSCRE